MYFWANVEIDPSEITVIKRVDNNELLGKLLKILTLGIASDKVEQETFTVISILQEIQMGLMRMGVNNVIRLAVDDYDYFFDDDATEDDLHHAMFNLESEIEPMESQRFNKIELELEHHDDLFKYLFDITIVRKHKVGEYPIKITVNGLFREFEKRPKESISKLRERLLKIFRNQYDYDSFLHKMQEHFNSFMTEFEDSLSKFIKIDGIKKEFTRKIIRPSQVIKNDYKYTYSKETDPALHGYPGVEKYLYYCMIWASACFRNDINCANFLLIDEFGNSILKAGNHGIYAGRNNTMNFEEKFEPSKSKDVIYFSGNTFDDILIENNLIEITEVDEEMQVSDFTHLNTEKEK